MKKSGSRIPAESPISSIGNSAARGAVWIYGRVTAVQLINLCTIAVLARELEPRAFGVVALASVALTMLDVLASQGVNQYVIYDREEGFEERAKAAFWLNILVGIAAVVIGYLAAPALARFFHEPQLVPVLRLLLLRYPFSAMTCVFDAIHNKELHFQAIEIRVTVIKLGIAAGSIGMALTGFGVWSIVVPAVLLAPVQTIVAACTTRWRPGWSPRVHQWPRVLKYASSIIGSSFTSFIIGHGDTLLVGRIMGSSLLGIYNLAWQTSNLICRLIVNPSGKLLFPMLSAVSDDRDRMCNVLRQLLRMLSAIVFPALIGLFVLADDFIHVIYGEKWSEAVLPLRIMIVYALRFSVGAPTGPVLKALGRADLVFKLGLITVPLYLLAIWLGSDYGIIGVAAGVTIVRTGTGGLTFVITARQLEVPTMYLIKPMVSALSAAVLMGIAVCALDLFWGAQDSSYSITRFSVLVGFGVLVYLLNIRYLFRDVSRDVAKLLYQLLGRRALILNRIISAESR